MNMESYEQQLWQDPDGENLSMDKEDSLIEETEGILTSNQSETVQSVNYTRSTPYRIPSLYKFKHWLASFKNFAAAVKISDNKFIDVMFTYNKNKNKNKKNKN